MAKNEAVVKVKLVRGLSGTKSKHRLSVKALGLRRLGDVRELPDNPCVRGLIRKVDYLVEVVS